ncbi:MAG TPA: alcohol dehydrogenase catalytic domain-containing protein [Salinisphaera sp.]|nr:alcohol dehydrogenase catalytic domain-containing protein [Salinisphaera sp.]HET7313643.1 alcohol dehydrogenase catalytic domain-containing protein [Salinisphaera sp.]
MKAVVFHDVGDIRLDNVANPAIKSADDAIIRITESAICGTDLHMVRGTLAGMEAGTILGHEAVGIVEETGAQVRNLQRGDRVVVPSTIACGHCSYCRTGYHAQCDNANPNGKLAGTSFFGGPGATGAFDGLQAEYARIPYANAGLVKLPDEVDSEDALMVSDIVPTAYFGAEMAQVTPGKSVAVFGCGPVGLFAIVSAQLMGAGRVFAIDNRASRLRMARAQGAEVIDFDAEDPVDMVRQLTGGIGADCAIDAVGVDSETARSGPVSEQADYKTEQYRRGRAQNQSPRLVVAARRRAKPGAGVVHPSSGEGRDRLDHRCLSAEPDRVFDRQRHAAQPHPAHGQLPPPPLHPRAGRPLAQRHAQAARGVDPARADRRRYRSLSQFRSARRGLDESQARHDAVDCKPGAEHDRKIQLVEGPR